jgi:hypothetical protein
MTITNMPVPLDRRIEEGGKEKKFTNKVVLAFRSRSLLQLRFKVVLLKGESNFSRKRNSAVVLRGESNFSGKITSAVVQQ